MLAPIKEIAIAPTADRPDSIRPARDVPGLWNEGRMRLRLLGPGGAETVAIVNRPFALVGRSQMVDLPVPSPEASLRHVYLHLDHRGVFAVDLISRSGTRFDDQPREARSAWLRPGRGFELAGHRVELIEAVPMGGMEPTNRPRSPSNPLAEADGLVRLELVPEAVPDRPIRLLSELSFLGHHRNCAIRATGDRVARAHGVLVRSIGDAFVVDLVGQGLTINGVSPALATRVIEGDRLELSHSRFFVRVGPAPEPSAMVPETERFPGQSAIETAMVTALDRALPAMPPELGKIVVAQALQAIREGQAELQRTNDQLQRGLIEAVRQLYEDQAALFDRHLERIDRLQHEIAALRAELRGQVGWDGAPSKTWTDRRPATERSDLPPLEFPPPPRSTEAGRSTSWLLERVQRLEKEVEQETQSGWRDLLSKIGPPSRGRGST